SHLRGRGRWNAAECEGEQTSGETSDGIATQHDWSSGSRVCAKARMGAPQSTVSTRKEVNQGSVSESAGQTLFYVRRSLGRATFLRSCAASCGLANCCGSAGASPSRDELCAV